MSLHKLYLVRHAKSSWENPALADHDRPLNKRGLRNAPEMGLRLHQAGTVVDQIVCSTALRARTTAQLIAQAMDYDINQIQQEAQLYFEGTSAMLEIIRSTAHNIQSLMLVAHNPDISLLANELATTAIGDMPTCAIAHIEFAHPWAEVSSESGVLRDFDYPKKPSDDFS